MKVITYTDDTMTRPRHVLAVVVDNDLVLRPDPLIKKHLPRKASLLHAAEKLEALRTLPGPKALEGWIRWQGLAVELEEVEEAPLEQLFSTPLAPRHARRKPPAAQKLPASRKPRSPAAKSRRAA